MNTNSMKPFVIGGPDLLSCLPWFLGRTLILSSNWRVCCTIDAAVTIAIRYFDARPVELLKSSFAKLPMKRRLILSETMVIKRSDQAEAVILHHDIIHNPATVFHFELQWIGTTGRYIERYGPVRLVEASVTQISDIRDSNAFQSCFPVAPPPAVPDLHLHLRVPEGTHTAHTRFSVGSGLFWMWKRRMSIRTMWMDVVYSYRQVLAVHSSVGGGVHPGQG
ncbi:hypothetical protein BDZ89DRAFT_466396 [Hymenopellis radicata]|nr:hypothetical protein BDZ89DRAFT_466396 [Hymenopellis radicata]